jgi:RNA polymerase sigma-70 factor (ECF subfamily)
LSYSSTGFSGSDDQFNIEALRQQNVLEFERLYRLFETPLRLYLFRLCGDKEMANDLLQETYVKAYNALPRTRPDLKVRPWLYKIATNTARSATRLVQWKRVLTFSDHPIDQQATKEFHLDSYYAEAELVEQALASIRPDYAAPLLLHWREGFDIEELCQILGLSRENLKKRLYRAKKAFSAAYARECARSEEGRA